MPVLIAAVILVGILCVLDLLLTFGVIRRLREHTELMRDRQHPAAPSVIRLVPGQLPEPVTAVSVDGAPISGPAGLRLAGFFSAWCSACPERVTPFIDYVRSNQIARDDVLVVLLAGEDGPPSYLDKLAEVAQVTVQSDGNPVGEAFGVSGYPAFCLLDSGGAVVAAGFDPAALPVPALV